MVIFNMHDEQFDGAGFHDIMASISKDVPRTMAASIAMREVHASRRRMRILRWPVCAALLAFWLFGVITGCQFVIWVL